MTLPELASVTPTASAAALRRRIPIFYRAVCVPSLPKQVKKIALSKGALSFAEFQYTNKLGVVKARFTASIGQAMCFFQAGSSCAQATVILCLLPCWCLSPRAPPLSLSRSCPKLCNATCAPCASGVVWNHVRNKGLSRNRFVSSLSPASRPTSPRTYSADRCSISSPLKEEKGAV